MQEGVLLLVERAVVAVAVIGAFVALTLTGHLNTTTMAVMGPLLGGVGVAWFDAHSTQVRAAAAAESAAAQAQAASATPGSISANGGKAA